MWGVRSSPGVKRCFFVAACPFASLHSKWRLSKEFF